MDTDVVQGIATMRLLGHKWGAIAAVFGYSSTHLTDLMSDKESVLYKLVTYGTSMDDNDVANAQLHNMMLHGLKGDTVKLAATKMVLDTGDVTTTTTTTKTHQVRDEILKELT